MFLGKWVHINPAGERLNLCTPPDACQCCCRLLGPSVRPGTRHCDPSITISNTMPQASMPLLQEDESKAEYWKTHCDPATIKARNGGSHFLYLEEFLKQNAGGQGWIVGTEMSIAGQCQNEGRVWLNRKGSHVKGRSQRTWVALVKASCVSQLVLASLMQATEVNKLC